MLNKFFCSFCTQPRQLETVVTQAKSTYAIFQKTQSGKFSQADFACVAMTYSRLVLIIATLSLPISLSAHAQVSPPPNLPQPLPPPQDVVPPSPSPQPSIPTPEAVPETPIPKPSPATPETISPDVPDKFLVRQFAFVGGTVFEEEELLQAIETALFGESDRPQQLPRTQQYPPVELSFAQLIEARSAITQLYIDQGYITSGAFIPAEQDITSGVVKIQIAEGSLEDIQIIGTRRLNTNYIRSRLSVAKQTPFNRDRLLEALRILQLNPLIDSLSVELSAGTRFGTNLLLVKVQEARSFQTSFRFDNNRSPSVGSFQRSVLIREGNVFGIGDSASLFYANTDGSNQVDLNYTIPLTPQNTTLSFNYGYSSSNVIERPFDELDISSNSSDYQVTLSHPVIKTSRQELALGLTASHRQTQTFLGFENTGAFPLTPGADAQGRLKITALRFFQQWTQRSDVSVFALRSQFSLGINALGATINEADEFFAAEPDSRFFSWRGQAQWVRSLGRDSLLVLRGDLQLADRRLVSSEQIALGGQASIRGYRQDAVLADNGAFGSIELRLPILRLNRQQAVLQIIPFVDIGTAWNRSGGSRLDNNFLASTGVGLRYKISDRFDARVDWGIPLISVDSGSKTLQDNGLYFSVLWNPF